MNIIFLNLSQKPIDGVVKAFKTDKLETVAGPVSRISEDLFLHVSSRYTDTIVMSAGGDAEAAFRIIRDSRYRGVEQPFIVLHDFPGNGAVKMVMKAGKIVLPVPLDIQNNGTYGIEPFFLRQQALNLHHFASGQQKDEFRFYAFQITAEKPSRILFLDETLDLTAGEQTLLKKIVRKAGDVLSHKEVSDRQYTRDEEPDSEVIKTWVYRIRKKINAVLKAKGYDKDMEIISTRWNQGLRLNVDSLKKLETAANERVFRIVNGHEEKSHIEPAPARPATAISAAQKTRLAP